MARSIDPDSEDRARLTVYVGAEGLAWVDDTRAILGLTRSALIEELIHSEGPALTQRHEAAAKARKG